jgi:hypothetical protein
MSAARLHRLVALLVASGLLTSVHGAAQSQPVSAAEPASLSEPFRINPSTGRLESLEKVRSQALRKGRGVAFFVAGEASTVEFIRDEPLAFAIRLAGPPTVEDVQKQMRFRLEVLAAREDVRFATGRFVPFTVQKYGDVKNGAQSFRFSPRVQLPLGEYAFSAAGLFSDEASGARPQEGWAFRIVEH